MIWFSQAGLWQPLLKLRSVVERIGSVATSASMPAVPGTGVGLLTTLTTVERVRWGIVGVGDVTERKSGPGFQKAERSELVAVMRRNGDLAADYARRHGVPRWYDDADELINDPEVDAVYVATPPDSHREFVVRVARVGKPVYVEKPMARTALECEYMISACDEAGVGLFVAYYRRAMPRFATVKELLDSGRLGQLRSVSIRSERPAQADEADDGGWRVNPEISGGGHFVDLGSHVLDLLDWLLGPVTYSAGVATNRGGRYRAEDLVTGVFSFRSGVEGVGVWNYDSCHEKDQVEITGTGGVLRFSCFGEEPLWLLTGSGVEQINAPYPETVQLPLIQTVVDALTGQGESPSNGHSALRTARVIDGLLADYRDRHGITYAPGDARLGKRV
jgi:predicted dehydrogenase